MRKNLTAANIITIFRILLVPIFLILYLNPVFYYEGFPLFAVLTYLLAFLSDVLDGFIARSTNTITNIGKILDPLADKLLRISVILAFYINGVLPLYVFLILLIFDILSIALAFIMLQNKYFVKANIFGKITTIFMSLSLFSCFFHNVINPYDYYAVLLSIVMVFVTLIQYFIKYYKIYKKIKS